MSLSFGLATKLSHTLIPISDSATEQRWYDMNQMRNYALFYGFTFLIFIGHELYKSFVKKKDKTEDKLDYVVESIHRIEERLSKIEHGAISTRDIQGMIREEINYRDSFKDS